MQTKPQIQKLTIPGTESIPTIIVRPPLSGPLPAVIVLHGHTGYKEDTLERLMFGASSGVIAVAIDARLHGERGPLERGDPDPVWRFFNIVRDTAADVSLVADWLLAQPGLCNGRIALSGGSMGGYIALAAAVHDHRFNPILSICGGADYALAFDRNSSIRDASRLAAEAAAIDPINHLDSFYPRKLMMIHGERDETVPYQGQLNLYHALSPRYAAAPANLCFISHPGNHATPPELEALAAQWLLAEIRDKRL